MPDTPHFAEKKLKLEKKLIDDKNLLFGSHVDQELSPRANEATMRREHLAERSCSQKEIESESPSSPVR